MPTRAELLRMADQAAADVARLRQLLADAVEQERTLRHLAEVADRTVLPGRLHMGTLGAPRMEAATASRAAKVSAARVAKSKSPWPFYGALHRRNLALTEWARAQRKPSVGVETAKSWMKRPSHGGRATPRAWANRIAAEFADERGNSEVPAVDSSWPNGIAD